MSLQREEMALQEAFHQCSVVSMFRVTSSKGQTRQIPQATLAPSSAHRKTPTMSYAESLILIHRDNTNFQDQWSFAYCLVRETLLLLFFRVMSG
ncbi:hypothetical protein KCU64_g59, partial [Aureobasidium melanogenum]